MTFPLHTDNDLRRLFDEIKQNGFTVMESYLSTNVIQMLSSLLEKEVQTDSSSNPYESFDPCHIHDLFNRHPAMVELLNDHFLDELLAEFLGAFWVMYAATSSSIPPKSTNFASRIHVDSPRTVPGYPFNMGVIWTLSDYNEKNGALQVLPGSHTRAEEPSAEEFNKLKVNVFCKAGSLIVFNARLYHRTTSNQSNNWRHAMTMNACRPFMKQRIDWVRLIGEENVAKYSNPTRRILGFDTRVPASMEEFCKPEAERLYKGGQG